MRSVIAVAVSVATLTGLPISALAQQPAKAETAPTFQPEPFWPKPLASRPRRMGIFGFSIVLRRCSTMKRAHRRTRPNTSAAKRRRP